MEEAEGKGTRVAVAAHDWGEEQEAQGDSLVSLKLLTRNTRLVEARKVKGVTQRRMAREIGMTDVKLSNIENLRRVPDCVDADKIATYLEKPIDYLFPNTLMEAIERGVFERRAADLAEPEIISLAEAQQLRLTYDGEGEMMDEVERHLLRERIDEVLKTLKPREAEVLRWRFGFEDGGSHTFEQVGRKFEVTRERIRQIEAKALRALRHPRRSRLLKDYLD